MTPQPADASAGAHLPLPGAAGSSAPVPVPSARPWEYSAFPVEVAGSRRIAPSWIRLTLRGEMLEHFAPWGLDQRIKLVLPLAGGGIADFGLLEDPTPHPSSWHTRWKQMPVAERNVLRTYTPAAVRPEEREIDVDVLLHDPAGPVSSWAAAARPGDPIVVNGPDARCGWTGYGFQWAPEGPVRDVLLVGDETAFPAIRGILAALPADTRVRVLLELGDPADDTVSADAPSRAEITVIPRGSARHGESLERALQAWTAAHGASLLAAPDAYTWIAGETSSVATMRRHLTKDLGLGKDRVAALGYWRLGGPLTP